MQRKLDQLRASDAYEKIKSLSEESLDWKETYVSKVNSLPATIVMCGLGQAAASLLAAARGRTDDAHHKVYEHLESWLCGAGGLSPYGGDEGNQGLMDAIVSSDLSDYLLAQKEALAWLSWLKKFAQAYLKKSGADQT